MSIFAAFTLLSVTALAPGAQAKVLKVAQVSASSTEPGAQGVSYGAKNIADGKAWSAWVEGEEGSGLGSWVQIDLDGTHKVESLRIWNGYWFDWDFWNRHNRIKELEVEFSDGTKQKYTLTDEFKSELIRLDKPVTTSFVKLKVKQVYSGSTFGDTALSEVQVINSEADDWVPVTSYAASSVYPADGDGNYEPANVADGLLDSMWCEGNKAGDGTGEWLEFTFDGSHRVSKLRMNNGNAYSMGMFMKANRAKSATLRFSDGSTEQIAIKTTFLNQTITFSPHTTRSVRITFDAVVAGKEFNDLCISEAMFLE